MDRLQIELNKRHKRMTKRVRRVLKDNSLAVSIHYNLHPEFSTWGVHVWKDGDIIHTCSFSNETFNQGIQEITSQLRE